MRVTGTAQHEAWQARTLPPVEQVRTTVWSVPVPIPNSPLRYTLCYLLTGDDGLVVVDPGWAADEGWAALTAGLAAAGATPADVTGIVVTHLHPDHHGLSGRLREVGGAWVGMHPAERDSLPARGWDPDRSPAVDRTWLFRCGLPPEAVDQLGYTGDSIRHALDLVEPDRLIEDGDLLPAPAGRVRAVWTPGHTPGHLCLHLPDDRLLLTGDHVLPRITPNIGLNLQHADPPLADFLASLDTVAALDDETTPRLEAGPAHEYRFTGVRARVRTLQRHHQQRCDEIVDLVGRLGKPTVWEVTEQLTWSRDWSAVQGFMRRAAVGETYAHLEHLAGQGLLLLDEPAGPADPVRVRVPG